MSLRYPIAEPPGRRLSPVPSILFLSALFFPFFFLTTIISAGGCSSPLAPISASAQSVLFSFSVQRSTHHAAGALQTRDAHIIFHAVSLNILPIITRRLDSDERANLRSGNVYAWEERGPHTEVTGLGIGTTVPALHYLNRLLNVILPQRGMLRMIPIFDCF